MSGPPVTKEQARDILNSLVRDARKVHPNAQLYVDGSGNLNLMSDDHHSGPTADARYDRVLDSVTIDYLDGGGW